MPAAGGRLCSFVVLIVLAGCAPPAPAAYRDANCRLAIAETHLQWYAPEIDRAKLDAWCATVAPPAADTAAPLVAPRDTLVVVAWNVHVGAGRILEFVHDLRTGRFTDGLQVRNFVLLVQEALRVTSALPPVESREVPERIHAVSEESKRTCIVDAAERLQLAFVYVPSMRNGTANEDRGNAILSTLPLRRLLAIELPVERQRRVAVAADIAFGNTALTVASVHLENRSTDVLMSFGAGRLRQIAALLKVLPRNTAAIVGGDLNTWFAESGEPTLRLMRERFPSTPHTDLGGTHRSLGRTTDHLFFRLPPGWNVRIRRVDDRYGSDHYPVLGLVWRD